MFIMGVGLFDVVGWGRDGMGIGDRLYVGLPSSEI